MQNWVEHGKRIIPGPCWINLTTGVELYLLLFGWIFFTGNPLQELFQLPELLLTIQLPGEIDSIKKYCIQYTELNGTENQKFRHSQKSEGGLLCVFVYCMLGRVGLGDVYQIVIGRCLQ